MKIEDWRFMDVAALSHLYFKYLRRPWVYGDLKRDSCEGRNPGNLRHSGQAACGDDKKYRGPDLFKPIRRRRTLNIQYSFFNLQLTDVAI